MKAVGIIAEYNPFHEGHAYQIRKAKELTGADYAVIIMNGDFVQRGEPAIFDKYTRAKQALEGGADFVFELPVRFGISSAGDFALGGVLALDALKVSHICFGSECGDLKPLSHLATLFYEESPAFREALEHQLRTGLSYPAARARALCALNTDESYISICNEPNNILGIEYLLALKKLGSSITPITLRRKGQAYHDTTPVTQHNTFPNASNEASPKDTVYPSASSLRKEIVTTQTPHMTLDDFSGALGYALLKTDNLSRYKDISNDLSHRMKSFLPTYKTFSDFVEKCHTKTFTDGRIRRGLFQCLIGLTDTSQTLPYLRLLGIKKEASTFLSQKQTSSLCILQRLAVDSRNLDNVANTLLAQDIFAADLYRQTFCRKYNCELPNEYQRSPIIVK